MKVDPNDQAVEESQPATIKCTSQSEPAPEFTWGFKSPEGELPDGVDISSDGSTISIPKCRQDHSGQWFCTGTNELGSNTKPAKLTVYEPGLQHDCGHSCV